MFVIASNEKVVAHMGFDPMIINARILTIYIAKLNFEVIYERSHVRFEERSLYNKTEGCVKFQVFLNTMSCLLLISTFPMSLLLSSSGFEQYEDDHKPRKVFSELCL
jgi:hypothetical protein